MVGSNPAYAVSGPTVISFVITLIRGLKSLIISYANLLLIAYLAYVTTHIIKTVFF